jgi:hypothetical protein
MPDERAEYLATGSGADPEDRERLDRIRDILADETTWSEPPPEVADQLIAAIGAAQSDRAERLPARRRAPLVAAAVVGVAAIVVLIAGLMGVISPPVEEVVAIQGTELQPDANGEAAIRETDAGWWIRLDVDDLPAANEGTYYEGWVWNEGGEGVSIGTFHLRGGDQPIVLWSGVDPADYPAIWVTLEDEDGDPSASDRIVMRGRPESG